MATTWKIHPAAQLFPRITGSRFEELKADIAERGICVPVRVKSWDPLGRFDIDRKWLGTGSNGPDR